MLAARNTERNQSCEIYVGKKKINFQSFSWGLYNEGPYIFYCTNHLPSLPAVNFQHLTDTENPYCMYIRICFLATMPYFIYLWSNCWDYTKLHKGSTEIWTPHPGPEIESSLFFLVAVPLHCFFPTGSGFTWSRYLLYGLVWKFDCRDKSGDKRKFWTEVLSVFVHSLNYAWLHRSSLPLACNQTISL